MTLKRKTGAFICFVGIDGSGKTTHAIGLVKALAKQHLNSLYVRPRYELLRFLPVRIDRWVQKHFHIRSILAKDTRFADHGNSKSILLHSSEHGTHKAVISYLLLVYALISYQLTIKRYSKRSYVVCDRYFFDWFFEADKPGSLALARLLPKPDLGFFMDIPVSLAYKRMTSKEDKFMALDYYESLRRRYISVSKMERFITIDSSKDFEKTKRLILQHTITNLEIQGVKY
jgi:thymidylate kinase